MVRNEVPLVRNLRGTFFLGETSPCSFCEGETIFLKMKVSSYVMLMQ